jgi:hypothetical protein
MIGNPHITQHGMGKAVAHFLPLFYADDGMLGSTNAEWLSNSFTVLASLFQCIGLETNFTKTELMVQHPSPPVTNIILISIQRKSN